MGKLSAQDLIKAGHTVYSVARSVDKMKDLEAIGGHIMKMDRTDYFRLSRAGSQGVLKSAFLYNKSLKNLIQIRKIWVRFLFEMLRIK